MTKIKNTKIYNSKERIKNFIKEHWLALVVAFVIGVVCIAPHIVFRVSMGDEYKGIYLMQTANELEYLSRMQEIVDGHWSLGSVPFYEYKESKPFIPPSAFELSFAFISKISGVSVSNLVIVSKFFLPAFLFFLIYFFVRQITKRKDLLRNKINAIIAGATVVLGYDLVDYRSLISYSKGVFSPNDFLIWTRPGNPILGGILIYLFLLVVWKLYRSENYRPLYVFWAGIILALGITSYFFTWGIILSLSGLLFFAGLIKKRYKFLKSLVFAVISGVLLSLPYFINIFSMAGDPVYAQSSARVGLFLGHTPIVNKFLVFSLIMFLGMSFLVWKISKKNIFKKDWWLFALSLILAGFIALNQQVITGKTVWPFHFVQYTIPLALTALFIIFYNFSISYKKFLRWVWWGAMFVFAFSSLCFGVYVQASTYKQSFETYKEKQKYTDVFEWIDNNSEKDCVVLSEDHDFFNRNLLVFTHCNTYLAETTGYLVPFDRFYYNYLVNTRLKGVKEDEIENYIEDNAWQTAVYLYGTEGLQYGGESPSFKNIKGSLIADYKDFLKKDFVEAVKKHKVDYLVVDTSRGGISLELKNELERIVKIGDVIIYKF
ncbi:MAG: hypothetical protein K9M15_00070 [Candidatus Marinimicrobia bacterium]|nr:hypothetical protein [Candidatus Neomarinimicrobiota bacterium]